MRRSQYFITSVLADRNIARTVDHDDITVISIYNSISFRLLPGQVNSA